MQLIQTSLPVQQFSHYWIYSARTEPFSLAGLGADPRAAQPLEHVLCAYWIFHESHIKSAGFEVHWGADIFTLPDQHHPYLSSGNTGAPLFSKIGVGKGKTTVLTSHSAATSSLSPSAFLMPFISIANTKHLIFMLLAVIVKAILNFLIHLSINLLSN